MHTHGHLDPATLAQPSSHPALTLPRPAGLPPAAQDVGQVPIFKAAELATNKLVDWALRRKVQ